LYVHLTNWLCIIDIIVLSYTNLFYIGTYYDIILLYTKNVSRRINFFILQLGRLGRVAYFTINNSNDISIL